MERFADRLDAINRAVGSAVRWLALLMVLVQIGIVVARYVYGVSSIAVNESVLYMHATLFMLGAGYTLLVDGHVRVDIFHARLCDRGKAAIDALGHLCLLIPSMALLLWWSWPSVRNAVAIWEGPISVGGIRGVWYLKALIPAFCGLLIVQSAACLLRALLRLRGARP